MSDQSLTPKKLSSIKTTDGKHEYPVDFVREFFINSDKNLEDMALQLNLPVPVVQLHARQGMVSWYQLQEARMEERMTLFRLKDIDSLMGTHSHFEDKHFIALAQQKGLDEWYKQYLTKHGHLFAVDEQDNIRHDSYGVPILLPVLNSKHLIGFDGLMKLKENTKMAMNHLYEETQRNKNEPEVLDIDDDPIFREVKK